MHRVTYTIMALIYCLVRVNIFKFAVIVNRRKWRKFIRNYFPKRNKNTFSKGANPRFYRFQLQNKNKA